MNKIDIYDNPKYYRNNKLALELMGIWPLASPVKNFFKVLFTSILSVTMMVGIAIRLKIELSNNIRIAFENLSGLCFFSCILFNTLFVFVAYKKRTILINQMNEHWSWITDEEELKILDHFASQGKFMTIVYIGFAVTALQIFCIMCVITPLYDKFMPLDKPREKALPLFVEYGINQTQYYNYLFLHAYATCSVTVVSIVAFDSDYANNAQHLLSLLAIVRHRLKCAEKLSVTNGKCNKSSEEIYKYLTSAIIMHIKALEYFHLIENTNNVSFLISTGFNMFAISFGTIDLMLIIGNVKDDLTYLIREIGVYIGYFIRLFYMSRPGEKVIESSNLLFETAYSINWYGFSNKSQQLVRLLILRSSYPCQLTYGGLYVLCYESFGAIVKTAISYVTVFQSFK